VVEDLGRAVAPVERDEDAVVHAAPLRTGA
jgi:hypothetical protein